MTGLMLLSGERRALSKSKLTSLFKLTDTRERMIFDYITQFIRSNCSPSQFKEYVMTTCNLNTEVESVARLFNFGFIEVAR